MRPLLAGLIAAMLVAGCSGGAAAPDSGSPEPSPATSGSIAPPDPGPGPTGSPSPGPGPNPRPEPTTQERGRIIFVQQAEDASLVAGGVPIRLTLARTGNAANWFSAPPLRLSGSLTTDNMMRLLGWVPSGDGIPTRLPRPYPQALLTAGDSAIAMTLRRASVRPDGTLVLDIRPSRDVPETIDSFGPSTLTIDGARTVRVIEAEVAPGITAILTITGTESDIVLLQITDGDAVDSHVFTEGDPVYVLGDDIEQGSTTITAGSSFELIPPRKRREGELVFRGTVIDDGVSDELERVVARWTGS